MAPIVTGLGIDAGEWPKTACDAWAAGVNTRLVDYIYMVISLTIAFRRYSRVHFGVTCVGEFSNDCGLFLRGVEGFMGATSYGGNCSSWQNSTHRSRLVRTLLGITFFGRGR